MLQALLEGAAVRQYLHQRKGQMQEPAGVRVLAGSENRDPSETEATQSKQARLIGIPLYSTASSFNAGQVTWLGLLEFIAGICAAFWLLQNALLLPYLAWGAATLPFLLLRTQRSVELGLHAMEQYCAPLEFLVASLNEMMKTRGESSVVKGLVATLLYALSPLAALVIRVASTAIATFEDPRAALKAVPRNFYRLAICIDLAHPIELVPGMSTSGEQYADLAHIPDNPLREFSKESFRSFSVFFSSLYGFLAEIFVGWAIVLPTLLYRITFKVTGAAWVPIIWCLSPLNGDDSSARQRLKTLVRGNKVAAFLLLDSAGIVAFGAKLLGADLWNWAVAAHDNDWLTRAIYPWQIAAGLSGLLGWALFLFADDQLERLKRGRSLSEGAILQTIQVVLFVRRVLGLYAATASVGLVIFLGVLAGHTSIGWKLFPWS